jgi:iron complex transport system substrate-binding protein
MKRRLLPLLVLLALLVAACGDDSPTADDSATADDATDEAADEPVVIEHRYGTTEFDGVPERIVSLNTQWLGALQALGVDPVGYNIDPMAGPEGVFPWEDVPEGAEPIEATTEIPFEAIAALDPDLILVTYAVTDQATYDQLDAIAPTIAALGERQVDTWQEQTAVLGEILRDPDGATAVIDDVEGQLADTAEELPGLEGQTFAMANYVPGDGIWVIADPDDGASLFFQSFGMEITPTILDAADGAAGRIQLSFEEIALLDSDLLVMFTNGADPAEIPGYDNLPSVQSGAVSLPDYADVVGLNTPSPLSVSYSLEWIRPALEAAAGE